ncbi:dTDP-4-dehydrorhamnose reductase [Phenylobacterium sp.]|uniref:dTDP-4-dehydrorhamnose reductase n=1 Tax=Phenylobacterium sp. TaxID=1871053 RepID=UPI00281104B5|nr:dTDP-4-dehydrorhamnose reductase [Phenylobacterium sp.]
MDETPVDILLTGGQGQLGLALRQACWPGGVTLHAPGRDTLDITDAQSIGRALAAAPFAAVINAAAYTAVDQAESDVAEAFACNALAPARLAEAAAAAGVPLIHVSTDYVFDGTAERPYVEDDPTHPLSVYGQSKCAGEWAVLAACPRSVVARTSWVISPWRANFLKTMLRLAGEREIVRVVDDQRGRPTSAIDLAGALAAMALRLVQDSGAPTGIYHLANEGETTWAGLAEEIFACSAAVGGASAKVEPIPTRAYPTPAARPMNSRLDTAKVERDFGIKLRSWRPAVREIVAALNEGTVQ